jgi:hypothetical protein
MTQNSLLKSEGMIMFCRHALPVSLFLLILGNSNIFAQQFSADLIRLKPEGAASAKVFVSGDKMRFETVNVPQAAIVIIDLKQQAGVMELPGNKTYTVLQPEQISPATPFFHSANPENACSTWETLVHKQGTCTKAGEEVINGRQAVKYKGIARNGDTGWAWVDRKLSFVIKWEGQAGAAELRNIKEGPQAADLFEIPKEYERTGGPSKKPEAAKKILQKPGSESQRPQK